MYYEDDQDDYEDDYGTGGGGGGWVSVTNISYQVAGSYRFWSEGKRKAGERVRFRRQMIRVWVENG